MSVRAERALLTALLVLFSAVALAYSVVVPPFEASDELWHYPMVKALADSGRLPVQDPSNVGPWRQEGSQPPLYYALGALATAWIDTTDMDEVRHLNVHVDNGVATADGNINLVVHNPVAEAFPWRGTVLALHIVRVLSAMMSTAAIYLTWRVVREVAPHHPGLALAAAGIHAFTPMYVFISGAVNNDNLVVPLSSLVLLQLIHLAKGTEGAWAHACGERGTTTRADLRAYALLGATLGLAALTKTSSLALTVLTAVVVVSRALQRRSQQELILGAVSTLVPVLLIAGWWYVRNLALYGDLSGLNVFVEILGKRDVPADLAQLWRERYSFAAGYWGNFGGLNVPLPGWAYRSLNWVTAAAAGGLAIMISRWLIRRAMASQGQAPDTSEKAALQRWPLALCLLWGIGVIVPWSQWAAITWSSQGRLVFAALPVWSMLLAMGLSALLPRGLGQWVPVGLITFQLVLVGLALCIWIPSAYSLPDRMSDEDVALIPNRVEIDFQPGGDGSERGQPVMRLLGYDVASHEVMPGEALTVTLFWEAVSPAPTDYSVFVHLLGEGELLVAQRDTHPGLGLLSATRLEPGYRWADRYVMALPETAFAPDTAQVEVGVFQTSDGTRLLASDSDGERFGDHFRFSQVEVLSRDGDVPNPISVEFGDRMALTGYDLSGRIASPGDEITLTLYWEARGRVETDYTVSAQLVDAQQNKAAQVDRWPDAGSAPTTSWQKGQLIVDAIRLAVSLDAAPGPYNLRIAVYSMVDGEIRHLPIVPSDGRMLADHIVLTQARVVAR